MLQKKTLAVVVVLFAAVLSFCVAEGVVPSVHERRLVTDKQSWKSIVDQHSLVADNSPRKFNGTVLGYITPWNAAGYEVALRFKHKFTHLSPTWLSLKCVNGRGEISGFDNVREDWVAQIHAESSRPNPRVLPRVALDGVHPSEFGTFLGATAAHHSSVIRNLVDSLRARNLDGIVWDAGGFGLLVARAQYIVFLGRLSEALHAEHMQLGFVVPPLRSGYDAFGAADMLSLRRIVDLFSVMTYDYSTGAPGPNAPRQWVARAILHLLPRGAQNSKDASALLLGLNWYGYEYDGAKADAILGGRYIDLLREHQPVLRWDSTEGEASFSYTHSSSSGGVREHVVYYPTLMSIQERLVLARTLGVGVAIWELGQGLPYFADLL